MFPWKAIITIVFLFWAILFAIIIEWRIRDGKLQRADTYSYTAVIKMSIIAAVIGVLICFSFYIFSKSLEVTITVAAMIFFAVLGGLLFGLLLEYQRKGRGGRRMD